MIFGKPPDHLIKVATLIKDFWKLWESPWFCRFADRKCKRFEVSRMRVGSNVSVVSMWRIMPGRWTMSKPTTRQDQRSVPTWPNNGSQCGSKCARSWGYTKQPALMQACLWQYYFFALAESIVAALLCVHSCCFAMTCHTWNLCVCS